MTELLFFYFAGVIVVTSFLVIGLKNPIYSAISLLVMFFHVAGLYVLLNAEFIAVIQIIVYAGAILVLYLFVVMLLNAGREERTLGSRAARTVGFPAIAALLAVLATVIIKTQNLGAAALSDNLSSQPGATNLDLLGKELFTNLLLPFEVTSVLILIAVLGAVALARRGGGEEK